jgi:hypothetical protein
VLRECEAQPQSKDPLSARATIDAARHFYNTRISSFPPAASGAPIQHPLTNRKKLITKVTFTRNE